MLTQIAASLWLLFRVRNKLIFFPTVGSFLIFVMKERMGGGPPSANCTDSNRGTVLTTAGIVSSGDVGLVEGTGSERRPTSAAGGARAAAAGETDDPAGPAAGVGGSCLQLPLSPLCLRPGCICHKRPSEAAWLTPQTLPCHSCRGQKRKVRRRQSVALGPPSWACRCRPPATSSRGHPSTHVIPAAPAGPSFFLLKGHQLDVG